MFLKNKLLLHIEFSFLYPYIVKNHKKGIKIAENTEKFKLLIGA